MENKILDFCDFYINCLERKCQVIQRLLPCKSFDNVEVLDSIEDICFRIDDIIENKIISDRKIQIRLGDTWIEYEML